MELSPRRIGSARAVLIAGPTASGKSALALELAEAFRAAGRAATIVNADSMQVYGALRLLTARPGAAEEVRFPHRLYGHVAAERRYSVGEWLRDAAAALEGARARSQVPIVVGGTGLYFRALTEGLAAVPPIPEEVRARLAERLAADGPEALHAALGARDPESAAAIRPGDPQRILRALEVLEATGRPLSAWQRAPAPAPLIPAGDAERVVFAPPRPTLYRRIDARFDAALAAGALGEVEALLQRRLDPELPAMKAIGVRELGVYLNGALSLEEAAAQAKAETRRYAKRQTTWFRHQMSDWPRTEA